MYADWITSEDKWKMSKLSFGWCCFETDLHYKVFGSLLWPAPYLGYPCELLYVLKSVRGKLYGLNRLKPISPKVLKLLYQAFVLPIFDYCDVVWSPSSAQCIRKLERVHSKFISSLPSSMGGSDINVTLAERRTYHAALQVFKILHNISPTYLQDLFSYTIDVTGHVGRNPHRLYVPAVRTNYGKKSLKYRGTMIWNRLSPELYGAKTLKKFKSLLLY